MRPSFLPWHCPLLSVHNHRQPGREGIRATRARGAQRPPPAQHPMPTPISAAQPTPPAHVRPRACEAPRELSQEQLAPAGDPELTALGTTSPDRPRTPGAWTNGPERATSPLPLVSRSPPGRRTRTRGSPPSRIAEKHPRHAHSVFRWASGLWLLRQVQSSEGQVCPRQWGAASSACQAPSWLWGAELASSVGVWGSGYPRTWVYVCRVYVWPGGLPRGRLRLDPRFTSGGGVCLGRFNSKIHCWAPGFTWGGRKAAGPQV